MPRGPLVHFSTGTRVGTILPALGCRREAFCLGSASAAMAAEPVRAAGSGTSGASTVNGSLVADETLPAASICCTWKV